MITNVGMAEVAALILTDVTSGHIAFDYLGIGWGTGSDDSEDAVDTDLQGASKKRAAAVGTRITVGPADDTAQLVHTFSAAIDSLSGSCTVNEIAVFNAASSGIMLFRKKLTTGKVCDWDAGDTLEVTGKCQVKQGA